MITRRNFKAVICTFVSIFITAGHSKAQVGKIRKTEKRNLAAVKDASKSDYTCLDIQDFLSAIAKISVIDSMVVDKDDFEKNIPFSEDCGYFGKTNVSTDSNTHRTIHYCYVNSYGDIRYYSKPDTTGGLKLYRQEKIGGKWNAPTAIKEINDKIKDIDYPFLMSDGVTLYFSGICKDNSFGKRDIFMARLDTDSMNFYKPENIGLPYNSKDNDYACIIDDINNIGWLVTDRRQPQGKVCIYSFIPSEERYDANDYSGKLLALSELRSVKDTQIDETAIKQAKSVLQKLKEKVADKTTISTGFPFIINDNTIYHRTEDFKSETNKALFTKMVAMKKQQDAYKKSLENLRSTRANTSIKKIAEMEATIEIMERDIKNLEKKIRNAENLL